MTKKTSTIFLIAVILTGLVVGALVVQQRTQHMNLPALGDLLGEQEIMPGMELPRLGQMPPFQGIDAWINSPPLTPADLKGNVVLVDFWTYSCINCIRTFPYLRDWWTKYEKDGLVIVGVHTPEFDFEKDYDNVVKAAGNNNLTYPIAQDNNFLTWRAYGNHYWPATYIFDKDGVLRYTHHGEGNYDTTEQVIQQLLGVEGSVTTGEMPDFSSIRSPETYFGTARRERYVTDGSPLSLNEWALEGAWSFEDEYAMSGGDSASLNFRYSAGVVNFVMEPPEGASIQVDVAIDGVFNRTMTVDHSDLYEVYRSTPGEHTVTITTDVAGLKVYTITFGA